ncbi:MAG: hypothetical protein Q8M15_17315 [Bacteroidota bacterium]|nr:hypothetical protein [Bacteroidota bacterium]
MNDEEQQDEGYNHSIKLMLIGGLLMLVCIVGGNKLIYFHLNLQTENQARIINNLIKVEASAFKINSYAELALTWFFVVTATFGLITVIYRLVKTWSN